MKTRSTENAVNRREFLSQTGSGLLAAALPTTTTWVSGPDAAPPLEAAGSPGRAGSPGAKKTIPIGVFDPVYDHLSLDEMLDKVSALGLEAMEIGTGSYPNNKHCALDDLILDKAKAKAWV